MIRLADERIPERNCRFAKVKGMKYMTIKEILDQDIEVIRALRMELLVRLGVLKPVKVKAQRSGKGCRKKF